MKSSPASMWPNAGGERRPPGTDSRLTQSCRWGSSAPLLCSAQIRATAPTPMALDRLHASSRGLNSSIHLDESPWLNGPKHCTDRRHQRDEVIQPVGRSNQDHHGHLEPTEVLLVLEVLVGGEEHCKVLSGQQSQ